MFINFHELVLDKYVRLKFLNFCFLLRPCISAYRIYSFERRPRMSAALKILKCGIQIGCTLKLFYTYILLLKVVILLLYFTNKRFFKEHRPRLIQLILDHPEALRRFSKEKGAHSCSPVFLHYPARRERHRTVRQ